MPPPTPLRALLVGAAGAAALLRPHLADLPLSYWPILQTHDTGTVYLQPTNPIDEIIYRFTRTQNAQNVTGLLDCGGEPARARSAPSFSPVRAAPQRAHSTGAPSSITSCLPSPARASLQRAHSTGAPSSKTAC